MGSERTSIPAATAPNCGATWRRWPPTRHRSERVTRGNSRLYRAANSATAVAEYERMQETAGRIMSYADLHARRQCRRPRDRAIFPDDARAHQRGRDRAAVLYARTQPARRCRARREARRTRRWRITGPGCAMCARCGPTSSATSWRRCCWKNRLPAAPPGSGCSTRPIAELRFPFRGRELTEAEAMHLLSDPDGAVRREAACRSARCSARTAGYSR